MKHIQLDLFGYTETLEDELHKLKCRQEKNVRSFFVRYNLAVKENEAIETDIELMKNRIDELKAKKAV